jgi:hypothetical protein
VPHTDEREILLPREQDKGRTMTAITRASSDSVAVFIIGIVIIASRSRDLKAFIPFNSTTNKEMLFRQLNRHFHKFSCLSLFTARLRRALGNRPKDSKPSETSAAASLGDLFTSSFGLS